MTQARRAYRRRYRQVRRARRVIPTNPFPKTLLTRLHYVDGLTLPFGSIASGNYAFSSYHINSIYDPYTAIGGHQPMYADQMAASGIYSKYCVIAAKITVTIQQTANYVHPFDWGFMVSVNPNLTVNPGTGSDSWNALLEFSNSYPRLCPSAHAGSLDSTLAVRGPGRSKLTSVVSIPRLFGIKKGAFTSNDFFWGTMSTAGPTGNPDNEAYVHVWAANPEYVGATPTTNPLYFKVHIEYITLFGGNILSIQGS